MATNAEVVAFIELLGPLAVNECNRRIANGEGFVLPSICIAQSALETNWGTAGIMTQANAFFGIKAGGSWTGKVYTADTKEVQNGVEYNTVANFRAYDSLVESLQDYYNLIVNNARYANGVSYHPDKILTAQATINAIWSGGYATDENYGPEIMNVINGRDLTSWDKSFGEPYNPDMGGGTGSGGTGTEIPSYDHEYGHSGSIASSKPVANFIKIK